MTNYWILPSGDWTTLLQTDLRTRAIWRWESLETCGRNMMLFTYVCTDLWHCWTYIYRLMPKEMAMKSLTLSTTMNIDSAPSKPWFFLFSDWRDQNYIEGLIGTGCIKIPQSMTQYYPYARIKIWLKSVIHTWKSYLLGYHQINVMSWALYIGGWLMPVWIIRWRDTFDPGRK